MSDVPFGGHHVSGDRRKRRRLRFLVLGVFAALLLVSPLIVGAAYAALGLRLAYKGLQQAQQAVFERRVDEARAGLATSAESLDEVEAGLRWMLFWRYVPVVRSYAFTLRESVGASRSTLKGLEGLLDVAELVQGAFDQVGLGDDLLKNPLAPNRTFRDLSRDEKRQILARVGQALPAVRAAQEQMRIALARWQQVPRDGIAAPLRTELDGRIAQFQGVQGQFDEVMRLAEIFLPLSGYPEPKHYLVILQNNQEMRGTGGFIGTVGDVTIDSGDIQKMVFQDVYSIDNPISGVWKRPSPAPIARWLEQPNLFLRDANWSPDVPESAQRLLDQYVEERTLAQVPTPPLDGIVLLEPELFRRLLALTGPIEIEDQTFTAENFFDALQYDVHIRFHQEGVPTAQRKEVVSKLGDALFRKLAQVPARRWPELLEALTTSLARKDAMLYMRDPEVQRLLDARDWSGRLKSVPGDYLLAIDTNMGALKTDGVMDKQILYGVDATRPGEVRATVTLRYRNTNATPNWRYTRYRNYARVYVPDGSELISSVGAMADDLSRTQGRLVPGTVDVYHELGKTVFGAFFAVEPGKTGELQFTYRLPPAVADVVRRGTYELVVQKQPGSSSRFVMDGRFPRPLVSALPAEEAKNFGDEKYQVSIPLVQDAGFVLRW